MRLFIRPYVAPIRRIRPISYGRIEAHSMRLFIRPYVAPIRPYVAHPGYNIPINLCEAVACI